MEIVVLSKKSLFQQKFQKEFTISTGINSLGVWCKKLSNRTSGVRVGQKNLLTGVVRNPTPPGNIQLRNPTLHHWCSVTKLLTMW